MGFYPFLTQVQQVAAGIPPPLELVGSATNTNLIGARVTGDTTDRITIEGGQLGLGNGSNGQPIAMSYAGGGGFALNGFVDVTVAGKGLQVKEGSNAKQGTFALAGAATTVVANTSVTATSRIFLQTLTLGTVTAASTLAVSTITAGTSFTVTPSQSTDTSTVAYEIFETG